MTRLWDPERQRRHQANRWSRDPEIVLGTKVDGRPLTIKVSDLAAHLVTFGLSGSGKTRFLVHLINELMQALNRALIVYIDPLGNGADLCRGWAYALGYGDCVIPFDPAHRGRVIGFDPIRPWPSEPDLQSFVTWETIRRAIDSPDAATAPLLQRWMTALLSALIRLDLSMALGAELLDYDDNAVRSAVIRRLPACRALRDLKTLEAITEGRDGKNPGYALSQFMNTVGSADRRMGSYLGNEHLRLVLGAKRNVLDLQDLYRRGGVSLVTVNLSLVRPNRIVLAPDDRRMLGLQIVSTVAQECMKRNTGLPPDEQTPTFLVIDEAQFYVSPEVEEMLMTGRQFGLHLILAARSPKEFEDPRTQDQRLLRLILDGCQAKVIFGGLGGESTMMLARELYQHRLDLLASKHVNEHWAQLSRVVQAQSTHEMAGYAETVAEGSGSARGESAQRGSGRSRQSASALGLTLPLGSAVPMVMQFTDSSGVCDSIIAAHGRSGMDFTSSMRAVTSSRSSGVSRGPMVVPGEPFVERTPVFWTAEELLIKAAARLASRPRQHGVFALHKDQLDEFRAADLPDPPIRREEREARDAEQMDLWPCFDDVTAREADLQAQRAELTRIVRPRNNPALTGRTQPAVTFDPAQEAEPAKAKTKRTSRKTTATKPRARRDARGLSESPPANP